MTTLILVRHGFSVANAERRLAGVTDFELSPIGFKQAELVGKYIYQNFKVDAIYSSDMTRACQTAAPAAELFSLPIIKNKEFRELYVGDWEGMAYTDIAEQYPTEFLVWKNDHAHSRTPNGESVREVYERVCPAILKTVKENPDKCILIVSHATSIRSFKSMVDTGSFEGISDIKVPNAAINVFDINDNGNVTTVLSNYTGHIEHLPKTEILT